MYNTKFQKVSINEISYNGLTTIILSIHIEGENKRFPLGTSGDDFLIYQGGKDGVSRSSQISIRKHSGMIEMLLTGPEGHFIFLGKLNPDLIPIKEIAAEFFRAIVNYKQLIQKGKT
ncbi:hypothetical protein M2132_001786 [Dysgonomonas sp. PH5-45]|uniref:hypothetical protein n=1 Tax=unclassified Dysgonomonas TaxID=2630389 RepID=UPI00247687C1|nr:MULTISPECIES: hypothetical protein [unclassified Dysgonomonas]MDH6355443.1 hypothetical protein [Dysgonomonas sp. PH5-45]MDH6388340.1 hypothetical protein [Dysgonomonas sp. PH5-37]